MINPANRDPRLYNRPTAAEIAVVMAGDGTQLQRGRDIIIQTRTNGRLRRVSELHSSFLPLRFPLIRPYGEQGWNDRIALKGNAAVSNAYRRGQTTPSQIQRGRGGSSRVSQAQWYSYYLHERRNQTSLTLRAGELLQEWIVDAWAQTEANRLRYLELNQSVLRVELYNGLMDAADDELSVHDIGKRTVLPSSFTGSPRQMLQLYQDGLAIIRHTGELHCNKICN